ncbi:alpha-amylase family glycosyl hydrolase [Vibrio maritimus]|uniref:alpha-amylase family glycosyl hydrolase n=1 Tax=Vibrio maritimus TaxID=990268 RepID=UPI003735C74A
MSKLILTMLGVATVTSPVPAEWFYRGTSNDWAAAQMSSKGGNIYEICQVFSSGDQSGGPRFKVDRDGNWTESYPSSDYTVGNDQTLVIQFDANSKQVSVEEAASCESASDSRFSQLYFRGTANNWASTPMTRVSESLWRVSVNFDGQSNQRFKFDVLGDWTQNYGDNDNDGVLDFSGDDIITSVIGSYDVEVDDQTLAYTLIHTGDENQAPVAQIDSSASSSVDVGTTVTFSAANSYDPDGSIASFLWNTGETTELIDVTFNQVGQQEVSVTVQDNQGLSAQASLMISVGATSTDSWYFRGTPNNWAARKMTSSGADLYCTEQSFGGADPRFKVDHYGDWTESYPAEDYRIANAGDYEICFNAVDKSLVVTQQGGADTTPPSVVASPSAGSYADSQSITLSVNDNQDSAPKLYFTTDGSEPTEQSSQYNNQVFTANDITSGVDLEIRTLAVDASGNRKLQSFQYRIGDTSIGGGDFRSETIYFLMTARFYDGDSSNNYYNRDRYKEGDPQWRGDFKGLIQQLDYIKDLGFTAIWVTPPVENRSGLDYHGYHAYDFYTVDPRLESEGGSYQDFINAAHAKGLKVIQDVVINHSSQYGLRGHVWIDHMPIKYYVPQGSTQGLIDNGPYQGNLGDYSTVNRCDDDNPVAPPWYRDACNSDPEGIQPIVDPKTGVTLPLAGYDPNRFFGIDAQGLDPNWYHLDGFMSGGDWENPEALQRKHMAGDTIDLATGNQNVKDYINGAIRQYLDMGVDAIRLDTVKHVERDELLEYVNNWKAHKPDLFVFGENLVKGTGWGSEIANDNASAVIRPWWYTRTTQDPSNPNGGGDSGFSVLDFSLFSTFRDNVTRGHFGGVGGIFSMDWVYGDATKLVTFFQNHDVGPDNDFKYRFGGEEANAAMVYNLLWTARGIPTLYYGEEIMFQAGLPQDIASANDTIDQTGRAYYGEHLENAGATQSHPLYQHIKRLNMIRSAVPALQKAPMSEVNEWGAGMSFVRDLSSEGSYAVVGLAAGGNQQINVSNVQNGTYTDAVSGETKQVSGGSFTFNVPAHSVRVWVLNGGGQIGSSGKYLK